jgi:hypothetical protein
MAALTTIAAGVGIAATAGTTTMSFMQAGKQKKAQRQAESDATQAMLEARKKLEVNVYDKLAIQKEPYELEREALLSQGARAIQAGVESERGAAATAGRIQMAMQEGQAGVRSAMGQELSALEKMSAAEESRLRDMGVKLDLGEVEGAQLAAADAAKLSAQATQQGMQGLTSMAKQASQFIPLFAKTGTPDVTSSNMNLSSLVQPNNQPMNLNSLKQPQQFINPIYNQPFQNPFSFNPFAPQYLNK